MTLERIDARITDARKQLDKAIAKRDAAITALTKSADSMKIAQRTLARLEKRRREARTLERTTRTATAKRTAEDGPLPPL